MPPKQAWGSGRKKLPNVGTPTSQPRRRKRSDDTEGSWNSRIESGTTIPRYNSLSDRYNPYTHTPKFAEHYAKVARLEEKERRQRINKRQKLLTASELNKHSSSMGGLYDNEANEDVPYVNDAMHQTAPQRIQRTPQTVPRTAQPFAESGPGPQRGTATPHGGLTFQRAQSSDPSTELEVLKSILLREGYLERLHHLARRKGDETALRNEVIDTLDLVRLSTVETIEAIGKWRRTLVKPYPFVWNGVNYLLKIPSDLDFLSKFAEIETWLGFAFKRNPFVVPVSLDDRPNTPKVMHSFGVHMSSKRAHKGFGGAEEFHQIGSTEPALYIQAQQVAERDMAKATAKRNKKAIGGALGGITGAAYETPVINDTSMMPASNKANEAAESSMEAMKKQAKAAAERPFPTHVGDVDMIRIRAAEKHIIEEETIQGRMMRDEYGRLVPEAVRAAIDAANAAAADYVPKHRAGKSSKRLKVREVDERPGEPGEEESLEGAPIGKTRARKSGGELVELTRRETSARARAPRTGRARAARLDAEIKKKQEINMSLADELERARQDLKATEAEVASLESAEKGDVAATTIQSAARARRARVELERRRLAMIQQQQEIAQREAELIARQEELQQKEAAREEYRRTRLSEQQAKREALLERKHEEREGGDGEVVPIPEDSLSIEDQSAIKIQTMSRRRLARNRVQRRRVRYNKAATSIQSGYRGRVSRMDVKRRMRERDGATHLQRLVRGHLGRLRVMKILLELRKKAAATGVQKIFRSFKGRRRMQAKKDLKRYATECKIAIERLFASDMAELCSLNKPPPIVVALCTCIRMLWPAGRAPPAPIGASCYKWSRMRRRMRRPHFLPRLRMLAASAVDELLQIPERRVTGVKVYYNDPDFNTDTFRRIGEGTKAATALHVWLRAIIEANDRIKIFLTSNQGPASAWCETEMERMDSESSDDEVLERELVKRYISHAVLRCPIVRPRPVVVAVARDIPSWSRKLMIKSMMEMLPGAFARIDMNFMDARVLQAALDSGQSLIVDVDIGIGAATRRAFISAFDTMKKTLQPTPLCLCIRGDLRNRHGGGVNPKLGVREGLLKMADRDLKVQLESAAEAIEPLQTVAGHRALKLLGSMEKPDYATCLILEAVLVLINPQKVFKGPAETVGYVSWEASRSLLLDPARLMLMVQRTDPEEIPFENLRALYEYVEHGAWPNLGKLPRNALKAKKTPSVLARGDEDSTKKAEALLDLNKLASAEVTDAEDDEAEVPAIIRLCEWVNALVSFSRMLTAEGGPAPPLSRKTSPFEGVTVVRDNAPDAYGGKFQGWLESLAGIYAPILRDMKVYGEARKINGGKGSNMVVSVYRDRQRIYFGCYDPKESVQRWAVTEDSAVNRLLAPNSIEQQGTPKPKPENPVEMYRRLVALLHLERPRGSIHERREGPPTILVVRRDLVPLFKESRKIDGVFSVINAAEEAPGEIRIHTYVPKMSVTYSLLVDEDTVAKLAAISDGQERKDLESGDGRRLVGPIVDRLQYKTKRAGTATAALELVLRMKGVGGRKILSVGRLINKQHHIISLYERSGDLRAEVYRPRMSKRHLIVFKPRERIELLGGTNWGKKPKWISSLYKRLSLKGPAREPTKQQLVLDRSVHSQGMRIGKSYLTLTFSVPSPWDDTVGGIIIRGYDPRASAEYILNLNDEQIRTLLEYHALKTAGLVKDGKRLGIKGVDDDAVDIDESKIIKREWPQRDEEQRVGVFVILAGLLHWQAEPRHSPDPCIGLGDSLSPLLTTFRTDATRTGRRVTSTEGLSAMMVPFEESGPLVFSGEHTVGLRKMRILVREEDDGSGHRKALRLLATGKGGSEFASRFEESELSDKLNLLSGEGDIQTPTAQVVPKLLQRLKCKQGTFILEDRASSSRGSERPMSRPASKGGPRPASRGITEPADLIDDNDGISDFATSFGFAEIVEMDGRQETVEDIEAVGERIYRKGVKILPAETREGEGPPERVYYVITAYLDDDESNVQVRPDSSASIEAGKGRFSSYGLEAHKDKRRWRMSLYDPNTSKHVGVTIGQQELKEVCGKRTDLLQRGREVEMTEYIVNNRLELRPVIRGPPGADTIDGKGEIVHERLTIPLSVNPGVEPPPYRLELVRARVFSRDKVTPLNKTDMADTTANDAPTVLIEEETSKSVAPYGGRGVKILNMAYRVIVPPTMDQPNGSTEFMMLSFFDMTNAKTEDDGGGQNHGENKLPRLRLIAYNPQLSYKLKVVIGGTELVKIVSSGGVVDEELMTPSKRVELAKLIAKCLRLQRRRNALPNLLTIPLEEALAEEDARREKAEEEDEKKLKEEAARLREEQFKFRKAEIAQLEKDNARLAERDKALGKKTHKMVLGDEGVSIEEMEAEEKKASEPWAIAANFINNSWKSAVHIEDQQFIVSATAIHFNKEMKASEGGMLMFSSESDVDLANISDEEELAARTELRLMITVYSPSLAEAASITVPALTVVHLLGGPLERLTQEELGEGLSTLLRYLDYNIKSESESLGAGSVVEPRLSISIDPDRAQRPAPGESYLKFKEDRAASDALESRPGRRGVVNSKDTGEEIFHRAMRIEDSAGKSNYVLVKVYSGTGLRGNGYRFEAYSPKLSHTAAMNLSEARLLRILGGRGDLLQPNEARAEYLAIVCSNLMIKNADIEAHMRMAFRNDVYASVETGIRAKEEEIHAMRAAAGYKCGVKAGKHHYFMKAVMEDEKLVLELRVARSFAALRVVVGKSTLSAKCHVKSAGAAIRALQDGEETVKVALAEHVDHILSVSL